MILSLVLGFVVLVVAAWVGYTVWDDARRIREAELRMKEAELEVRYGIAAFRLMLEQREDVRRDA